MTDPIFFAAHTSQRVRQLFERRASRFGETDYLVAEIARRMFEKLAIIKITPQRVVDAGCGHGLSSMQLQGLYPDSQVLALDMAWQMLQQAQTNLPATASLLQRLIKRTPVPNLLQADMRHLPLKPQSLDMIFSNLAVHWVADPGQLLKDWASSCKTGGLVMLSCFGPDTLKELRSAYAQLGRAERINPFVDMHDWGDLLVEAGFGTPVMDMEKIIVTYDDASKLLADVRLLGAATLPDAQAGLKGRGYQKKLLATLESQRNTNGKLTLTYEILYGHAWKAEPRRTSRGEAIVKFEKLRP
ncbi:methyltransferase domain-containing protein [Ampullimonas aquatilis]|uniref:methyltransferase domain-containing protein n=1 Tax=Ampullimonas aquatilis TaxID=1341549 RepID=UPI003C74CC2B